MSSAAAKTFSSSPSALTIIEPASFSLAPVRSDDAELRFHAAIRQMPDALGLIIRERNYSGAGVTHAKHALIAAAVAGAVWCGVFGLSHLAF
jgi:hypothetical protein